MMEYTVDDYSFGYLGELPKIKWYEWPLVILMAFGFWAWWL